MLCPIPITAAPSRGAQLRLCAGEGLRGSPHLPCPAVGRGRTLYLAWRSGAGETGRCRAVRGRQLEPTGLACLGCRRAVMRGAETGSGSASAGSDPPESAHGSVNAPSLLEEDPNPPAHRPAEPWRSRSQVRGLAGVIWEGSALRWLRAGSTRLALPVRAPPRCPQRGTGPSPGCPDPLPTLPVTNPSCRQQGARGRLARPRLKFTPPWLHIAYPGSVALTKRGGRGLFHSPGRAAA